MSPDQGKAKANAHLYPKRITEEWCCAGANELAMVGVGQKLLKNEE